MNQLSSLAGCWEGSLLVAPDQRFAVVASKFNRTLVDQLLAGARDAFQRHGARAEQVVEVLVPGAWETPVTLQRLARTRQFHALVALGIVIRGDTAHFDYVAGHAAQGIARVEHETGVPIAFGVLTTETVEQAADRAGGKLGNKGFDAAVTAIEMANLFASLKERGYELHGRAYQWPRGSAADAFCF